MTSEELRDSLDQARSLINNFHSERAVPYLLNAVEELLKRIELVRAQRDCTIDVTSARLEILGRERLVWQERALAAESRLVYLAAELEKRK